MGNHAFVHLELTTDEPNSAREFYGELFAWSFEEMDMGEGGSYFMVKPGDGPDGGITGKQMPEQPTAWMPYVQVEDIGATITKSESLGGRTVMPETPIPGMGTLAVLRDPTGATLGIWRPA